MVGASDPTVRGGTSNPYTLRKNLRAQEIARANRLPAIGFVESGGADLPRQKEIFVPGGANFRNLTRRSGGRRSRRSRSSPATAPPAAPTSPGMSDYTVMVREQGLDLPRRPAAGEDGDRGGGRGGGARRRRDALPGLRRLRVHRRRRGRRRPDRPRDRPQPELAQARARAARRRRRPDPRPRGAARDRLPRPADPLRRPRGDRPGRRRLALRRVQARLRHPARHRLGGAPRLADRDPRQQRRDLQRGRREGRPLHPARRPRRHAAAVHAEHDRLHRRRGLRAARHRQGRREDDQRRRQRRRPEADADDGRLLRRRQLRDVRAQLRARGSSSAGRTTRPP